MALPEPYGCGGHCACPEVYAVLCIDRIVVNHSTFGGMDYGALCSAGTEHPNAVLTAKIRATFVMLGTQLNV